MNGSFLEKYDCVMLLYAPHRSHMGGFWEGITGSSRRILESVSSYFKSLTHEVLDTLTQLSNFSGQCRSRSDCTERAV